MDKKSIREFLETVGEIKDLTPTTNPGIRLDPDSKDVVKYNGDWVEIKAKDNPTLGFKFIKLKPVARDCQLGCGKKCEDQVIEHKVYTYPQVHWRTYCKSCQHTVSPDGQTMLRGPMVIQKAFCAWFSANKE